LQLGLVLIKDFQITRKRCSPLDRAENTGVAKVIIVVAPVSRGVALTPQETLQRATAMRIRDR
jgi:hypothetical protein